MNISPPVVGGTIQVYKYESFNYLITPTAPADFLTVVNSPEIPTSTLSNINNDAIQFSANPYTGIASVNSNSITVTAYDAMSNILEQTKFPVSLNAARFFPPGNNVNYTFYRNEPIVPISFATPLTLNLVTKPVVSAPSIPVGLSFVQTSPTSFDLSGTPIIQSVSSNYKVIGTDISGRTITSTIGITVNPERMLLDVSGTTTIPIDIGTNITPVTVTARFPPYPLPGGLIQYKWSPALPGGTFVFRNSSNVPVFQPFVPIDASSTITLTGAIDSNTIQTLATAGIQNYPVTLTGTRTTSPNISNSVTFNFTLSELVLFNGSNLPTLHVGVPTSNVVYVQAKTYFADSLIVSMSNTTALPSGLTGVFDSVQSRFYLNGTPTSTSYTPFTIRATNDNGVYRDTTISNLSILQDTVSFNYSITPAIDTCYNFIQYRPLDNPKTGWYSYPIQFRASTGSGCNITMASPELASRTDIVLAQVNSNTYQLTGSPETSDSLSYLNVVATSVGTDASASTRIQFRTSAEQYTFSSNSIAGIQNVPITPIQLSTTTLSERPVINYSSTNLPPGISLTTSGLLSGTPTGYGSGTSTYTASTGYSTSNTNISYNIVQDNILIAMAKGSETVSTTSPFSGVDFRAVTYSGINGTLTSSNLIPYQAPTKIDISMSSNGILSGDLSKVTNLFPRYGFDVTGTADSLSITKHAIITITNSPTPKRSVLEVDSPTTGPEGFPQASVRLQNNFSYAMYVDAKGNLCNQTLTSWSAVSSLSNLNNADFGHLADYASGSNTAVIIAGPYVYRSTDKGLSWFRNTNITKVAQITGPTYTTTYPDPIFTNVATDGSGTYVAIGYGYDKDANFSNLVRISSDDGVSWTDTKLTSFVTSSNLTDARLYYNNGRYLLSTGYGSNVVYSDSPTTTWTSGSNLMYQLTGLGFSNNTVIAVGSNTTSNKAYISQNNGTSWSAFDTSMNAGDFISDIAYANGYWLANVASSGDSVHFYSTDTSNWSVISPISGSPPSGIPRRILFDGNAWTTVASNTITTTRLEGTSNLDGGFSGGLPFVTVRNYSFTTLSNGTPTATITIPYDPSGYAFINPSQSNYTFYQYCPIPTIPVDIAPLTSNFIYYYASGLPQGLQILRDVSGIRADISGTSTKYSDAYSNVALFAVIPNEGVEGYTIAKTIGMQTVVPRIIRPQESASSYTSLVRQYVEVNAAQNARDNRVFPAVDATLGEFMSPGAPSVTSAPLPCDC